MATINPVPRPAYVYDETSGTWIQIVGLQGESGPTGPQGVQGITGSQGIQGSSGIPAYQINTSPGADYTFTLADTNVFFAGFNTTFTIPPFASVPFPIGTQLNIHQSTTGTGTNIIGGAGVTISSAGATSNNPRLGGFMSAAVAIQIQTNNWSVFGDIV